MSSQLMLTSHTPTIAFVACSPIACSLRYSLVCAGLHELTAHAHFTHPYYSIVSECRKRSVSKRAFLFLSLGFSHSFGVPSSQDILAHYRRGTKLCQMCPFSTLRPPCVLVCMSSQLMLTSHTPTIAFVACSPIACSLRYSLVCAGLHELTAHAHFTHPYYSECFCSTTILSSACLPSYLFV